MEINFSIVQLPDMRPLDDVTPQLRLNAKGTEIDGWWN